MRHRWPPLALASSLFALVAGVAGWFLCDLFANPLVGLGWAGHRTSAACAALAGAVVGALLAPSAPASDGQPPRPSPARITAVVFAAGASTGALLALLHPPASVALGAGYGFLCAIPFAPAAALGVAMLRRAGRARPGSIVARADRRGLVATLAVALGACTGLAILDWPASALGDAGAPLATSAAPRPAPYGAATLLAAAAAVVAGVLLMDLAALRRARRMASSMDAAEAAPAGLPSGRVDLGVGDEITSRPALGTAYRGGAQAAPWVVGDFEEAIGALQQSIRRGAVMLALLEMVGLAHGAARGTGVAAECGALLCDEGHAAACRPAALLSERGGAPDAEALRVHRLACSHGEDKSCLATELLLRRAGPLW
jgi:hypothetical protein